MGDLAAIDYDGKILYSAFCEPLLNKDLEKYIALSKRYVPGSRIEIVSNGDLVTLQRLQSLFEAGLDTLSISMYDGPQQIEHFTKISQEAGLDETQVILRRRYFEDGNYGMTVSNRAGIIDSNEYRDAEEEAIRELPLKRSCFYPFYMILVDLNGDLLLCPHDWGKRGVIGNLAKENLWELWKGEKLEAIRQRLMDKDRNFPPCVSCDVYGDVIGQESFDAWYAYHHKKPV